MKCVENEVEMRDEVPTAMETMHASSYFFEWLATATRECELYGA